MRLYTTNEAQENLSKIINFVNFKNEVVGIGQKNKIKVILIKYSAKIKPYLTQTTHLNDHSEGFTFLHKEPDIYSVADLKKNYV